MACRMLESFDTFTTLTERWDFLSGGNTQVLAAAARTGIAGLRSGDHYIQKNLTAQGTWVTGFAYRTSNVLDAVSLFRDVDGATVQGALQQNALSQFEVLRGATVVATSTLLITLNVFYYLEFKHIIANAGGTLEMRVNGAVWATFTGDTQQTANPTADRVALGPAAVVEGATRDFDDFYLYDGTGAINNDYAGDSQIERMLPTGAGTYTEFTNLVGAATHWQAVNEVPPNGDTSYAEATVLNQRDTFALGNVTPTSATIPAIQMSMRIRKTAAGALNAARMYRSTAGVDNQGADIALSTSYVSILEVLELEPVGAVAWTVADVNGMEAGARAR